MKLFPAKGWLLAIALVLTSAGLQAGSVTVMPTVTMNGSLFHYNYSISNGTGLELAVLDIAVTTGPTTITSLVAPTGFQKAYDSGLGLVSFLEDTKTFGASAISGFAFDSPYAPATTGFQATLLDANFNASTASGNTLGPRAAVTPEPGSILLFAFAAPAMLFLRNRTRASFNPRRLERNPNSCN